MLVKGDKVKLFKENYILDPKFQKPAVDLKLDIIPTDNKNKLLKKVTDPNLTKTIKARANWNDTSVIINK